LEALIIFDQAASVKVLNSCISPCNSFWISLPFWKSTGMLITQANMAIALRPMADVAAKSVGVILPASDLT